MELYNVPNNTRIRLKDALFEDEILLFHHIDGMYSYCTDMSGGVIHLAAWTDVEVVDD